MRNVTLGKTGIAVPQNAFGALPIQRISTDEAVNILKKAYDGGITYFDTARAYTDSEEKIGKAFKGMRDKVCIATKTMAKHGRGVREDLEQSLKALDTDYIDVYQLHLVGAVYEPDDETGVYETLIEAQRDGKILHFGVTAHLRKVAIDNIKSGLYETMQFPLSYLSNDEDLALPELCKEHDMGFIAMKSLAGGLITRSDAAMAFLQDHDNVLPIWGIQKESELDEWLGYMENTPVMTDEIKKVIETDREELSGDFCRGCGYCMKTCPANIAINQCARMSLLLRRSPSELWLTEEWEEEMENIENCINCRQCVEHCPYHLETPELLRRNLEDYRKVLAGEVRV